MFCSSLAGRIVFPFFGIYCASKFAVEAMAESYRYELKSFGVDSVIVEPGPFWTRLIDSSPGSTDEGPNPYEILIGGLAACTAITLRWYDRTHTVNGHDPRRIR